jgi:hydrogenase expression/formation protein HypC
VCLGIPGKVIEVRDEAGLRMGRVDFGGVRKEACLSYVPEVSVGDYVIVHVGFAISQVDEEEALRTLELLDQMGDLVQQELATMGPGMSVPVVVDDGPVRPPADAQPAGTPAGSGGAAKTATEPARAAGA